ncbi:MAG: hypothetical protein DI539_27775, partial [Flavobacterium psychrophilum]
SATGAGYRFGFNGQEMSNEIKGFGNSYTAQFWEYDSRVGRRWNLDPRPTVGLSPYATFNNNPISFSDPLGDTTKIYNSKRELLNTINDKSALQVLVIDKRFDKPFENIKSIDYSKKKQEELDEIVKGYSTYGLMYEINPIRNFYNTWAKAFEIEKIAGQPIAGRTIIWNNKPLTRKLYAEVVAYLSISNGRVVIPDEVESDRDLFTTTASGTRQKIHLHPDIKSGTVKLVDKKVGDIGPWDFKAEDGLSGRNVNGQEGDSDNVGGFRLQGEMDIMVDKKNIYIYNKEGFILIKR